MRTFRLTFALALAGLALAACGRQATPTPFVLPTQPLPTETAAPVVPTDNVSVPTIAAQPTHTATPAAPTSTPTPLTPPTATVPPTPDPNEGVGDIVFNDALDGTGNWYWSFEDDAASFGVSGEQKQLNTVAKQSGTWRFTISNDTVKVGNQQIRVNAHTNVCADADQYAFLFRGTTDPETNAYSFYAFKLRCDGSARLELMQGNNVTALVDWTASPAIKPGANADNAITIWANKDQMRFYINDQYVFSAQDTTLTAGFYGFLVYDRTNANMSVSWKGLEARAVTTP